MRWLTVTPHTSGGIDSYETARRSRLLEEEKRKKHVIAVILPLCRNRTKPS